MTQIEKYRFWTRKCSDVILRDTLRQSNGPANPGANCYRESKVARVESRQIRLLSTKFANVREPGGINRRSIWRSKRIRKILRYVNGNARHGGRGRERGLWGRKAKCQTHFHRDGARRIPARDVLARAPSRARLAIYISRLGDLWHMARNMVSREIVPSRLIVGRIARTARKREAEMPKRGKTGAGTRVGDTRFSQSIDWCCDKSARREHTAYLSDGISSEFAREVTVFGKLPLQTPSLRVISALGQARHTRVARVKWQKRGTNPELTSQRIRASQRFSADWTCRSFPL